MPKLEVWHDPHTDVTFRNKADYVKYLKESAWYRFCERKADKYADKLGFIIAKRQDHVKTCQDLTEFINEYWELAYNHVSWANYRSPKHDNAKLISVEIHPTSLKYERGESLTYLSVLIKIDADESSGVLGWYGQFVRTLGLCVDNGGWSTRVTPGKWHLLNVPAQEEYNRQYKQWQEDTESEIIMLRLKNENTTVQELELPEFKYKEFFYANS